MEWSSENSQSSLVASASLTFVMQWPTFTRLSVTQKLMTPFLRDSASDMCNNLKWEFRVEAVPVCQLLVFPAV